MYGQDNVSTFLSRPESYELFSLGYSGEEPFQQKLFNYDSHVCVILLFKCPFWLCQPVRPHFWTKVLFSLFEEPLRLVSFLDNFNWLNCSINLRNIMLRHAIVSGGLLNTMCVNLGSLKRPKWWPVVNCYCLVIQKVSQIIFNSKVSNLFVNSITHSFRQLHCKCLQQIYSNQLCYIYRSQQQHTWHPLTLRSTVWVWLLFWAVMCTAKLHWQT